MDRSSLWKRVAAARLYCACDISLGSSLSTLGWNRRSLGGVENAPLCWPLAYRPGRVAGAPDRGNDVVIGEKGAPDRGAPLLMTCVAVRCAALGYRCIDKGARGGGGGPHHLHTVSGAWLDGCPDRGSRSARHPDQGQWSQRRPAGQRAQLLAQRQTVDRRAQEISVAVGGQEVVGVPVILDAMVGQKQDADIAAGRRRPTLPLAAHRLTIKPTAIWVQPL
jgi:hypothetical protein